MSMPLDMIQPASEEEAHAWCSAWNIGSNMMLQVSFDRSILNLLGKGDEFWWKMVLNRWGSLAEHDFELPN